jgi:predicted membrane protein
MNKLAAVVSHSGFSLLLALLCGVLFSWPVFAGVRSSATIFVYLFIVWAIVIAVQWLLSRVRRDAASNDQVGRRSD